jgi:hypothetical protein
MTSNNKIDIEIETEIQNSFMCENGNNNLKQTKEFVMKKQKMTNNVMKKTVPYYIKTLGTVVAFGVAGLFANACKDKPDDKTDGIKVTDPCETEQTAYNIANIKLNSSLVIWRSDLKDVFDAIPNYVNAFSGSMEGQGNTTRDSTGATIDANSRVLYMHEKGQLVFTENQLRLLRTSKASAEVAEQYLNLTDSMLTNLQNCNMQHLK